MNIRSLKIKVIAPVLLIIPMACMHTVDDHHSGGHFSFSSDPSFRSTIQGQVSENMTEMEGIRIAQDSKEGGLSGGSKGL